MMGQENKDTDVESLQLKGRRGRCLDAFLVTSVVFLFVAVAAVTFGGATIWMKLRSQELKTPSPTFEFQTSKLIGDKKQKSVYLEAVSSQLKNCTVQWAEVLYGAGSSVGSHFSFDEDQSTLTPKRKGTYFIYVEFNLTCTYICNAGRLSVNVGDKLTCEVHLPAVQEDPTPVTKKCWTISHVDKKNLITQMTVPKEELQNWKLELTGSGLGMFLVD